MCRYTVHEDQGHSGGVGGPARRAAELLGRGKGVHETARLVGASPSWVSRRNKALRRRGADGLAATPHPGPRPRLNGTQKRSLAALLRKGAVAAGCPNDLWTCRRVRDLIVRTFGVRYDFNHVGRVLHGLGLSVQKPEARARERDDAAIERWRKKDWPRIKETRVRGSRGPGGRRGGQRRPEAGARQRRDRPAQADRAQVGGIVER